MVSRIFALHRTSPLWKQRIDPDSPTSSNADEIPHFIDRFISAVGAAKVGAKVEHPREFVAISFQL